MASGSSQWSEFQRAPLAGCRLAASATAPGDTREGERHSDSALQRVADVLVSATTLDQIVPSVLEIVTDVFGAAAAGYFGVSSDNVVRLRYWKVGSEVLSVEELLASSDLGRHDTPRRLAQGLTVPDSYLGAPTIRNLRGVFIDHVQGTSEPQFDEWLVQRGWGMELNVPLVAGDRSIGTLTLHRANDYPYSEAELRLAESLVKQLTVAVRFVALAEKVRRDEGESVRLRERARAAQERAETFRRMNQALRKSSEQLNSLRDPREVMVEMLRTGAHLLQPLGVIGAGLVRYNPEKRSIRITAHVMHGAAMPIPGGPVDGEWPVDLPEHAVAWKRVQTEDFVWGLTTDSNVLYPSVRAYHESFGTRSVAYLPLRRGNETTGFIGLNLTSEERPSPEQVELIQVLAAQAALASAMEQMAQESRDAAVAHEREHAAQKRAKEAAKAVETLQRTVDTLASVSTKPAFIPAVLDIVAEAFSTNAAAYYEHLNDDLIYLRYLKWDGIIYGPGDFRSDGTPVLDLALHFANGFTLPRDYLGGSAREVNQVTVIDHFIGTSLPGYDQIAIAHGSGRELRIPLVVDGEAEGALIVYRTDAYTTEELSLAAALSQQLTLGVQLHRSASSALETSISREREEAARQRAAELARINDELLVSLMQISSGGDYRERLQEILGSVLRQLRAAAACVFLHDAHRDTLQIIASAEDPACQSHLPVSQRCKEHFPAASLPLWIEFHSHPDPVLLDVRLREDAQRIRPMAVDWHILNGRPVILALPLVVEQLVLGYLSVTFAAAETKETLASDVKLVGKSLASLLGMVVAANHLSRRAQDAAVAEEKNRLAQELHDTLAGAFTGIFMQLQAANELHPEDQRRRQALLEKAESLSRTGLRQLREFVHTLAFSDSDPSRVVEQMRETVSSAGDGVRVRSEFRITGTERRLKPAAANALLRILREAIGNIQRYAAATSIHVSLHYHKNGATLVVKDNGSGFDLASLSESGFGIPGMQARMHRLGGTLLIETAPGRGTTITATLPDCCEPEQPNG